MDSIESGSPFPCSPDTVVVIDIGNLPYGIFLLLLVNISRTETALVLLCLSAESLHHPLAFRTSFLQKEQTRFATPVPYATSQGRLAHHRTSTGRRCHQRTQRSARSDRSRRCIVSIEALPGAQLGTKIRVALKTVSIIVKDECRAYCTRLERACRSYQNEDYPACRPNGTAGKP